MRLKRARLALVLAALLGAAGCTPAPQPTPTVAPSDLRAAACQQAVDSVVAAVDARIALFATPIPTPTPSAGVTPESPSPTTGPTATSPELTSPPTPNPTPSPAGGSASAPPAADPLDTAVAAARDTMTRERCPRQEFTAALQRGLAGLNPRGVVATAVRDRVSATLLGAVGDRPASITLGPDDDLGKTLAEASAGSTITLSAGTYTLTKPLVLLDQVSIVGAGRGATSLRSSLSDATVVVATGAPVQFRSLSLLLDGRGGTVGIVAGSDAQLILDDFRVSGATAGGDGKGGAGVQLTADNRQAASTETTLQVTGSTFERNAWAGILLSGGHRTSVQSSTFAENGQCGICFLDSASGSVEGSTFTDNLVGVGAMGAARPTVVGGTITGGAIGVQVSGGAAPTLTRLAIRNTSRAALIFTETSAGYVDGVTCTKTTVDIAIAKTAAPTLGKNACAIARGK